MACIDGTTLEGGGQLLRISIGLSALTGQPLRITRIRAKRRGKPGLKLQHLAAVRWLTSASNALAIGAQQQSQTLDFFPPAEVFGQITSSQMPNLIPIGSAGSIALVFQAILPFILFASSSSAEPFTIKIRGGTNVPLSPAYDYIDQVLLPTLARIGLPEISATLNGRCWAAGISTPADITFKVNPLGPGQKLQPFRLENRGSVASVKATLVLMSRHRAVAERELSEALRMSFPDLDESALTIDFEDRPHKIPYLLIVATTSNGYRLGRGGLYEGRVRGTVPAIISHMKAVTAELVSEIKHGGCVDVYMRDQLVVFQGLADGKSFVDGGRDEKGDRLEPSLHARTAEWVVEKLLGARFDGQGGCQGVGFAAGERFAERGRMQAKKLLRKSASLRSLRDQPPLGVPISAARRSPSLESRARKEMPAQANATVTSPIVLPLRTRRFP